MTYKETISWLETPDKRFRKADKEDFSVLMKSLGSPQDTLRFIHVTGSNGKGSICVMLAEILRRAGYKTGLYTSPHLSVYNERCRVNGEDIPDEDLARLASTVRSEAEKLELSLGLFYKMTALSLLYLAEQKCDVVVLEVGRGGRRDCTNIVTTTELAVIGSVSLEHTEVLGSTIAEIAAEKSGIFKKGAAALMLFQAEEAMAAAQKTADSLEAALSFTDPEKLQVEAANAFRQMLSYRNRHHLRLNCPGAYQAENVQIVLDAVDILKTRGFRIPEKAVRSALSALKWPGRFETVKVDPLILIDGAHNIGAFTALADSLAAAFPGKRFIVVLTLLWDRPWQEMLQCVGPFAKSFIAVETQDPKALKAKELAGYIREELEIPAAEAEDEEEALRKALAEAGKDGSICVCGSLYLAGAIRDLIIPKN